MRYENKIYIHKDCIKFLKRLDLKTKERVKKAISSLASFPLIRLDVVKLKGYENIFRLRVGRIRVIFEYKEKDKIVFVKRIDFRESIYD